MKTIIPYLLLTILPIFTYAQIEEEIDKLIVASIEIIESENSLTLQPKVQNLSLIHI